MAAVSAGIMVYRPGIGGFEVLLVHAGGPFWKKKDLGAWSVPKGLIDPGEEPLAAARREFAEETGLPCPEGEMIDLAEIRMASGKRVRVWAVAGDVPVDGCRSNAFRQEWPPKSGKFVEFPEVDQWRYFPLEEARAKINANQAPLLDRLLAALERKRRPGSGSAGQG
jgi:predicted NUDIX family NTP pyrophosphohydrolase